MKYLDTYKNKFYDKNVRGSREFFSCDLNYKSYNGFEIHKQSNIEFHIVKDSICLGMYAGLNGAKGRIDEIIISLK